MSPSLSLLFASLVRGIIIALATRLGVAISNDAAQEVAVIIVALTATLVWSFATQKKLLASMPDEAAKELAQLLINAGRNEDYVVSRLVELGVTDQQARRVLAKL